MQLVINTFGAALRKRGERFLVSADGREVAVSVHKVHSILVATGVMVSSDALQLAAEHNVDVVFLGGDGEPYARVWQPRLGSTAAIRRRQMEAAAGPEGLGYAREWVEAKLTHQAEFLAELRHRRPDAHADFEAPLGTVENSLAGVRSLAGTLEERRGSLMGLEGAAGRAYFACLGRLVPEQYRFDGRSRQPARDAFNAMLNYTYGVLYSLVERAVVCAGLDPCLGLLHTDGYNKPSLVFDMIEPFRILGDRTALLLFTGRRVKAEHIEPVPGGVGLTKEGRATLLTALNERLEKGVRYPVQDKPGKSRNLRQRDVVQCEAHALANRLLGRSGLPRVVETRALWAEENEVSAAAIEADEDAAETPAVETPAVEDEGCEEGGEPC